MLINFLGVRTAAAAVPAAGAAAAMAGAAYAALGPLSLAELLPGGEDRRQDYGCHCYGVCHFLRSFALRLWFRARAEYCPEHEQVEGDCHGSPDAESAGDEEAAELEGVERQQVADE